MYELHPGLTTAENDLINTIKDQTKAVEQIQKIYKERAAKRPPSTEPQTGIPEPVRQRRPEKTEQTFFTEDVRKLWISFKEALERRSGR